MCVCVSTDRYIHTFNFKCHKTFVLGIRLSLNKAFTELTDWNCGLEAVVNQAAGSLSFLFLSRPAKSVFSSYRNICMLIALEHLLKNSEPRVSGERAKETTL